MAASQQAKRIAVFCYGSNGIEQVRSRCKNVSIQSEAARLPGWRRVFAGKSKKWDGGGVASILRVDTPSSSCADEDTIFGSVVWLTPTELEMLDAHEGCYEPRVQDVSVNRYYRARVNICLGTGNAADAAETTTEGEVYVRTSHEWE